jgi:DNA-binding transcriptional LysR family regulator
VPDGAHLTMLPRLLRQLRTAPNVQIHVSGPTETPEEDLRNDRIDLAIALASPLLQREFRTRSVVDQGWLCLTRAEHPTTALGLDTYREAHHVNITHSGWSRLLQARLSGESWQRHVTLTMPGVLGLPELLASTDLIVTLPEQIAHALCADPRLRPHPCPIDLPTVTVSMYWSHRHDADPGHRWLRQQLTRSCTTTVAPLPTAT